MYAMLAGIDLGVASILVAVWVAAVIVAGRMSTRKTLHRMRFLAGAALVLIGVAGLLALGRIGLLLGLASPGWEFVGARRLGTVLIMMVGVAGVAVALPRLLAIRKLRPENREQPPTAEQRLAAYAPWLIMPIQVATLAALPGLFEKYLPPYRAVPLTHAITVVILVLLSWLLVLRFGKRRARLVGTPASRRRTILVRTAVVVAVLAVVGSVFTVWALGSRMPDTFSMIRGTPDYGGGEVFAHGNHLSHLRASSTGPEAVRSVDDLKSPSSGQPDRRFTLTAEAKQVRFGSGATVDAWTFNGQVPGPELRVREGELVEVTLVNRLPAAPVTIHWHGVDVPNGEDGVAGVTQDAVRPGQSYTYRFRADEVGSRWYHSHQQASEQVSRGLFGPLVIEPRQPASTVDVDRSVILHDWKTGSGDKISTLGASDDLQRELLAPGSRVRLRLVNSSNLTKEVAVTGVPYRVTAYDGTDVNAPGELTNSRLVLAGGGRYDVEFTMPATPVRVVDTEHAGAGIAYSADGRGELAADTSGPELDPLHYGKPAGTPFGPNDRYDRSFTLTFDVWLGFYDGTFALQQTVNGLVFPDVPMQMVRQGELIRMTFVNRGEEDHPIHIHGHHFLVLGRNGERPAGSPIWLDTINVRPGEAWEIAFKADNPGIWMDHCHNFEHTQLGMVLHLAYENVTSPYLVGGNAHNHPD